MSLSHHGPVPMTQEELDALKRMVAQIDGTARREYPAGRMGAEDDGALSYAVATDHDHNSIIIRFGKEVEWIGLGVNDARQLVERLQQGIRDLTRTPR